MTANSLISLAADLNSGRIRVVDLTQTLAPEFPQIVLPPEFGQCWPFRIEEISRYDERGSAWYWNNFSCGEHTGTHFDAPVHWVSGRDLPDNSTDTLPVEHLIGAACVIDCSAEARADPDFLLTADHVRLWEAHHGRIAPRSWVLMRTDWSKSPIRSPIKISMTPASTRPGPPPMQCASSSRSAMSSDSDPKRSVPMPARAITSSRRTRATTTCTAQAATGCNA